MRRGVSIGVAAIVAVTSTSLAPAAVASAPPDAIELSAMEIKGLIEPARVRRDENNIPHIFALNDRDAFFMMGYIHAQDRLFQMDFLRRVFSGTLAELVGNPALASDVQLRTLGLRRAAEASLPVQSRVTKVWLEAYARGVNAFVANNPLPPEYTALELTTNGFPRWTSIDSLTITKGLAFGLSFDLADIDFTVALGTFQAVGDIAGFDGTALFFEDLYRTAPFDPSVSIPATEAMKGATRTSEAGRAAPRISPQTLSLAKGFKERVESVEMLRRTLERRYDERGSNWWLAAGSITDTGNAMLANDPHLALGEPSTFHEIQVRIAGGDRPAMNAIGVSFPGVPGIVLGCNPSACWGATVHPMDVTDVYQEQLVIDPLTQFPTHTVFDGQMEPLVVIPQTFLFNQIGDAKPDNLIDAGLGPLDGGLTLVVPRRNNGAIVSFDFSDPFNPTALSVQYTGWGPTRELDAFRTWARSYDLATFKRGLEFFDVGSQNFAYADVDGTIAYHTSAEMPIREDLQNLMAPDGGVPPWLIRDGTHQLQHEWMPLASPQPGQSLPWEILPAAEMPHEVNPQRGYILNANNDPIGTSLDNNPLSQLRPGGGLLYLSPGYATGFRMGRLQRLFDQALADKGKVSFDDIKRFQGNNQLLDAEVLTPHILTAFTNAQSPMAPVGLQALGADPELAEAVDRLAAWDFSTPTGIQEGFDPGDDPANLPAPGPEEIANSVAATIYSVWRGQTVRNTIDATLAGVGLDGLEPGSSLAMAALRHLLDTFDATQGVGASGLPFFNAPGTPSEARDAVLLKSLRDALDLLAGDEFEAAFGHSTDQDDYRWGYLHRIVFQHELGGPFSVPPSGPFPDLGPGLPGISRAGGFGALDASSHSARADSVNDFMFGHGPARRFVGEMLSTGAVGHETIPGGESGVLGHPDQGGQLPLWLTNDHHGLHYRPDDVVKNSVTFQVFRPTE